MQLWSVGDCFDAAFSLCTFLSPIVNQFLTQEDCFSLYNHNSRCEHRCCSGRIVAFQAFDMGSIPVRCNCHPLVNVLVLRSLSALCSLIVNQFLTKEYCYSLYLHQSSFEHRWCSGSIVAFQAVDMGSIPVRCNCDPLAIVLIQRFLSALFYLRSSISFWHKRTVSHCIITTLDVSIVVVVVA